MMGHVPPRAPVPPPTRSPFIGQVQAALSAIEVAATLPITNNVNGRIVLLSADGMLYQWMGHANVGGSWVMLASPGAVAAELAAMRMEDTAWMLTADAMGEWVIRDRDGA